MSHIARQLSSTKVATLSTGAMAAVNGACSVLIARALSPEEFRDYVVVTMAVTLLIPSTKGIQVKTAASFVQSRPDGTIGFFQRERQVLIVASCAALCWLVATPILIRVTDTSWQAWACGGFVLASAFLQSRASGTLQGLGRFATWQSSLVITCALQIPIIFLIREIISIAPSYVLALTLPSVVFYLRTLRITYGIQPNNSRMDVQSSTSLGGVSLCLSIVMLSPFFFLTRSLGEDIGNTLTALILVMQTMVGLSGLLGSFQLPEYVLSPTGKKTTLTHLLNALPTLLVCSGIVLLGTNRTLYIFGPRYSLEVRTLVLALICASYVIWSATLSILNERLVTLSRGQVRAITILAGICLMPMMLTSLDTTGFFMLHLIGGVLFFLVLAR